MGAWLYPVSGATVHGFRDETGRRRRTSYDDIRQAVECGVFPKRNEWPCMQNGANLERGDALFVYTGEDDIGIFAAGRVVSASPNEAGRGWLITWDLDPKRTQALIDRPVAAQKVRKHVHPRVTVRDFTAGARALRRSLG